VAQSLEGLRRSVCWYRGPLCSHNLVSISFRLAVGKQLGFVY